MSLQNPRAFAVTFATGATMSNSIDLGGGYLYVSIEIPGSIQTGFSVASTPFYVQGSSDGTTFRRFKEILTSTVTTDFSIASSVSNAIAPIAYFNCRYVKIEMSGTVTTPSLVSGFKILCTDSL